MKRLLMPALFALLTVSLAAPGCAGKFPGDIWPALKSCGASDVTWAAATEVFGDLVEIVDGNLAGETDLLAMLANDFGGGIPCLVNYFETQGGTIGAAATKFKVGHAKEMKAAEARGPVSLRCPTLEKISKAEGGGVARASGDAADERAALAVDPREGSASAPPAAGVAPGEKHSASPANPTLASCDVVCGSANSLAPPSGCLCQRKVDGQLRWVASR